MPPVPMRCQLASFVPIVALVALTTADLPNHCLRDQVAGDETSIWTLHLGPANGDKNIQCKSEGEHYQFAGTDATEESTILVKLSSLDFTATKVDSSGSDTSVVGTWTMIYDEGWELRIHGKKFFSWCKYNTGGQTFCNEVSNGMFHNDDGTSWGCYWAKRTGPESVNGGGGGGIVELRQSTQKHDYKPEIKLVEAVNSKNLGWKARRYPEYDGMTFDQMRSQWGGIGKPMPQTAHDIDDLLAELQISQLGSGNGDGDGLNGVGPEAFPHTWDWRDMNGTNYINPAYSQGWCGSCWAVAAADALSARVAIASKNKIRPMISAQEMLVCSSPNYAQACSGGFPFLGYKYAQDYGIGTGGPPGATEGENCYDYTGHGGGCELPNLTSQKPDVCNADSRIKIKDYYYVGGGYGGGNVASMMRDIMENGPISVCIEPSSQFQHYDTGIFEEDESLKALQVNLNPFEGVSHAVVVVGWGTGSQGTKYWIMKNSMGSHWGDQGFAYVPLGVNAMSIENMPTGATVELPTGWETNFKGASHHN